MTVSLMVKKKDHMMNLLAYRLASECHVYDSAREVICYVRARLHPEALTAKHRKDRHQLYRDVLAEQAEQRRLYEKMKK